MNDDISAQEHYNNGVDFYNAGNYEDACEEFEKAIKLNGKFAYAYNGWGNALLDLKRYDEAIEKYKRALEIDPNYAYAYNGWGNALQDLERYDEAIEKYEKATDIDPDYKYAYNGWGNALQELKRYDEAIEKYEKATEIDPDYKYAYRNWGLALANLKHYNEAIEKYEKATRIDLGHVDAYNDWANALQDLERYDEAIEKYEKATEIDPDYKYAYNGWGNALSALQRYDEAIEKYKRAIEIDHDYAYPYNGWGNALLDLKRYDEAIEKYEKATKIYPNSAHPYNGWGNALLYLRRNDEAIEKYKKATKIDPEFAYAYNGWGNALSALNRYDEAIEKYEKAIDIDPVYVYAYFNLGNALSVLKEYEQAVENYNNAIKVDSQYTPAYHNKAHYLWVQGMYEEARQAWEETAKAYESYREEAFKAGDSDYFRYYGSVLHETFGELDRAEAVYRQGLELNPENEGILIGLVDLYLEKKEEEPTSMTKLHWKNQIVYKKAGDILSERLKKEESSNDFVQLGKLYLMMEEFNKAEDCLKNALKLEPESEEANLNLGILYNRRGKYKEDAENKEDLHKAIEYFEAAMRLNPDNLYNRSNLGEIFYKLQQYDEAEKTYKDILNIAPYQLASLIGLGEVYSAMAAVEDTELYGTAIDYFEKCIFIATKTRKGSRRLKNKEKAAIYYSLGFARVKQFEASDILKDESLLRNARNDFKECCKFDPAHYKAQRARDKIHAALFRFTPQRIAEKVAPWIISLFSAFVFITSQICFFWGISYKTIDVGYYITLTFGSLIILIAGLTLPNLLKLRIGAIELEKSAVEQVTTSISIGLGKSTSSK